MNRININLYSRQIYTYGIDILEKIINLKFFVFGLRGLGIEVTKNLILAGPKQVTIYDTNICAINDLTSNFFIEEKDVLNKRRDIACLEKLSSLNPYVCVDICQNNDLFNAIKNYNFIIITEIKDYNYLFKINKYCRENNIGFIYTGIFGLSGFLFNDFGNHHIIYNQNGLDNISYKINYIIKKEKTYEISINIENGKYFELNDGDYVKFKEIKGLEELNDCEPIKIKIINAKTFSIEKKIETENNYISGGIVEEFKMPKEYKFYSLEEKFLIPYEEEGPILIDKSKRNENALLHCAIISLFKYFNKYKELPELNNLKQANEIVEIAREFYSNTVNNNEEWIRNKKRKIKEKYIPFDESYIIKVALWAKSEINPICAFLGGIVAQEVIKITGKYIPIYQWFRFDFFEVIENLPKDCNRELLNSRYDDQIAIFGQEIQKKLSNLNIFMIGAGALGCEYLKNFALMGISTSEKKENKVILTDNDNIELSNLSRQFLFRNSDIGNSKSICACREVKKMNNNFNCEALQYLVCENTIDIFDDNFWENQNIIITAVDNLKARKYIDKKCTFYSLILIDAGTNGMSASSDIFYPGKTICLNDLPEPVQTTIALCTLKKFPTEIIHCIEWSKEVFKELFEESLNELKMYFNNKDNLINILKTKIDNNELYFKLEKVKHFSNILENTNKYNIIEFAFFLFNYYFNILIKILIEEYPLDKKLQNGQLFWECGKRPPHSLELNIQSSDTILFFKSFYYILSHIINYREIILENEIICIIDKLMNNNKNYKIEQVNKNDIEIILKRLEISKEKIISLNPINFEKDNDENYHVNFILSLSNLRADNYKINKSNFLKVKEIAGKIIPAVTTTTATITGISSLQIYTLLQTDNIKSMRSSSINLGISNYDIYKPEGKRYFIDKIKTNDSKAIKVIPEKYSLWDYLQINGPKVTVGELIKLFKLKYNIDIDFINSGSKNLSSPFEDDEDFSSTIEELYSKENKIEINSNLKYIELKLISIDSNYKYSIPVVKYCLIPNDSELLNKDERIKFINLHKTKFNFN